MFQPRLIQLSSHMTFWPWSQFSILYFTKITIKVSEVHHGGRYILYCISRTTFRFRTFLYSSTHVSHQPIRLLKMNVQQTHVLLKSMF